MAVPEVLAAVTVSGLITYQNGDVVRYLELLFRCRPRGGSVRVNDTESIEVSWHPLTTLGRLADLEPGSLSRINVAVSGAAQAAYAFSGVELVLGMAANPDSAVDMDLS